MYKEETNLQEQVNVLSEELRNVKMQLQALYKYLNLNVNAKREVVCYTVHDYSKLNTAGEIAQPTGLAGIK